MNKKLKSNIEVENEIDSLFNDVKDKNDLSVRVQKYLNNITGKEFMSKSTIENLLILKIIRFVKLKGKNYFDEKIMFDLLPFEKYLKSIKSFNEWKKKSALNKSKDNIEHNFLLSNFLYHTLLEINDNTDNFEAEYLKMLKKNKTFSGLHSYLKKNPDTVILIRDLIEAEKRQLLADLIIRNMAPLSAFFHFFDFDKNVKQNTLFFYKYLKKKYSRHTIQTAIMRELENIKTHKFSFTEF